MDAVYQLFPFNGYKVITIRVQESYVKVALERLDCTEAKCHRCLMPMTRIVGRQRREVQDLDMSGKKTFIRFTQLKGRCKNCNKVRLEAIDFLSDLSPHMTKRLALLLGRLCEISPTSSVADLTGHSAMTMWRTDLERLRRFFERYEIPQNLTELSVDEVYAKSHHNEGENRSDRFFTIISDLKTRKVIWVEPSRSKKALDRFFELIGPEACANLEVIATDQHDEYTRSIAEYCPNAIQIFDRFHLMRIFEEAVNNARKRLYKMCPQTSTRKYAAGKFRFIFLKADSRRTDEEKSHMEKVMEDNDAFYRLELIKERMLTFFEAKDEGEANGIFMELREWIWESGIPELKKWWNKLAKQWSTISNYFMRRVTTALSEGINNVIKSLKRQSFGFRNMEYFSLKIMQKCGYLNSQYMTEDGKWTPKALALLA